jgi:uncharacterized protein YgiM (DUF1202 family)
MMQSLSRIMLAALAIFATAFSVFAQSTMYVTTKSGLILRDKPSKDGTKQRTIPYGDAAEVSEKTLKKEVIGGKTGYWREVTYKGTSGYAFDAFLSDTKPTDIKNTPAKKETRYSNARSGLIIRSKPNRESTKLITIPFGIACKVDMSKSYGEQTINDLEGNWRECTYKGKTGYVFDAYLSESPDEMNAQESCGG